MRRYFVIIIIAVTTGQVAGQGLVNLHNKKYALPADSILLSSLSIVPGSLSLSYGGRNTVPDTLYTIDYHRSVLYPSDLLNELSDSINISYRVFPFSWFTAIRHKDLNYNRIDPAEPRPGQLYKVPANIDPFAGTDIVSNGDISRGIMVGNSRDPSLSSNLNLQLSGKISRDYRIEANLSDSNIPIQPEGNTQQIQEFDRLYLRIYNSKNEILGGDFVLGDPSGYFLRMNKKVQGARISTQLIENQDKKTKVKSNISGAVVKGKYSINKIQGQEGNQGPYRLSGKSGESYIQIIAGSEKVYIDGKLMSRGETNDYVIDYNTAEIRFTPKVLITKDKRITAEFEYTEQSYARFLVSSNTKWEREKGEWFINLFSEQDARNQPLLQDLTDSQKSLLSGIGDKVSQSFAKNYYEAGYRNDRVLYRLTDTIVDGVVYDSVLVYSIHPDSARYQAGFSFTGSNMGDYIAVSSSANGQVYQWVAPVDGIPQGNYAPYTRLVSPQSKQVLSFGGREQISSRMDFNMEMALTRNDLNTFSDLDDNDNIGYGLRAGLQRIDPIRNDSSLLLTSELIFRRVGKNFDPLERYRSVEFERDWNLDEGVANKGENYLVAGFSLRGSDSLSADYRLELLNLSSGYKAIRNISKGGLNGKGWSLNWSGSQLNSSFGNSETSFSRHDLSLSKDFKFIKITAGENHEGNIRKDDDFSIAGPASFKFQEWSARIENGKSKKIPWFIQAINRTDFLPENDSLKKDSRAMQLQAGMELKSKRGSSTLVSANWRKLDSYSDQIADKDKTRTLTGRVEEKFQIAGGALVSRTFYEFGSGLERKTEFSYIEVAPGQGYYTWTDYNGNGNKELDEFEPAYFRDLANYIRIFRPGTTYLPSFQNRLNQLISINPGRFFKKETGISKTISRFSNTLAYRDDKKSFKTDILDQLNPFSNSLADSMLLSETSQFRNTLSFNRNKEIFGLDYYFEKSRNKMLMSYGTDSRNNLSNRIMLRGKPLKYLWLTSITEFGEKEYFSSFFTSKNYIIEYIKSDADISFKPADRWQGSLGYEWRKENSEGEESIIANKLESSISYQMPAKGQIRIDITYISLDFTGESNSPVAYVMLQGLGPGHNGLINLSFRRKLNELIQLDLQYEGRVSEAGKMIHTGNVQIRAVF